MRLDRVAADRAIRRTIADPLRLDLVAAAWGIHSIVNENMAAAARLHIIERNRDPRDFALASSGGAGAMHACIRRAGWRSYSVWGRLASGLLRTWGFRSTTRTHPATVGYII